MPGMAGGGGSGGSPQEMGAIIEEKQERQNLCYLAQTLCFGLQALHVPLALFLNQWFSPWLSIKMSWGAFINLDTQAASQTK